MNDINRHAVSIKVCRSLVRQLEALRDEIEQQPWPGHEMLTELPVASVASAQNLLHYLVLRSRDLRPLQEELVRLGLSPLCPLEAHVLPTIDAVLHNLYLLLGQENTGPAPTEIYAAFDACANRLHQNAIRLLGAPPENRRTCIMVTMPTEAAHDYLLVHELLDSGVDCLRINCAHDDSTTWKSMLSNLRYAERSTGKKCRVLMDLAGRKLRTGAMEKVPGVLRIRPIRDRDGKVIRSARIWLTSSAETTHDFGGAINLILDSAFLEALRVGDRIRFQDARASQRRWKVKEVAAEGCWAEARKTAYVMNGITLQVRTANSGAKLETVVSSLPLQEGAVRVRVGDVLLIEGGEAAGTPALRDKDGKLLHPGKLSLPIPEIYRDTCPGETVYIDDGRIAGIIRQVKGQQLQVRITQTHKPEEKLTSDKGINFPDSNLDLPILGSRDIEDLEFAARNADMVGLSFASRPEDLRELREQLARLGDRRLALVVKIETKRGFSNLPGILLEALKFPACGVMIARGDLAVEIGFERLSEVQEEILWVCEAAHVPVIWATQVLEALAKHGHATRSEITDAAMGQTAECVMLNKGPHITLAIQVLDDILQRMQGHHAKKRSMLRRLELASLFRASVSNTRKAS